jgi:uncharacterized membrane protein YdjX (TVP38/TMEM64 family)
VLFVLIALVAAFFAAGGQEALEVQNLKARLEDLRRLYSAHPLRTVAAFFSVYVALATTSLPGGAVLTLLAGAVFGVVAGTAIVSFASSLGALFAMLLTRYVAGDWVRRRIGARLRGLDEGIERDGALYLFMIRLVPAIPFIVVNVGMGLSRMPAWRYYWVSQLGMLPGSLVFANAGERLAEIQSPEDVLTARVVTALVLLAAMAFASRQIALLLRKRKSGSAPEH